MIKQYQGISDDYHPRYPDAKRDYYRRLMWFARVLQTADQLQVRYLAMNKEHRERIEEAIGYTHSIPTIAV